ncbi:hypothetical protein DJ564_04280 [Pseudomonas sp. 31-12]|nr:hypothetical protein DJ564_04280 [Pseudomonas sp. 31-12]
MDCGGEFPTSIEGCMGPVGAGLLAMAVCQSTSAVDFSPLSRASPLPQEKHPCHPRPSPRSYTPSGEPDEPC